MKDFLKFTLATVTGIILSSIVLFIIGMVTLFGIVSTADTETIVKKNSVMMLDLNGVLVERTQESPLGILSQLFSDDSNTYGLDDILSSIKKAKENENIKGIYLQASMLGTSYASLQEIRNALLDFKESGKFIIAYGDSYTQGLYYLSSVADKVLLNPKGMIEWKGIASAPLFYKDLLQKIGVEMQMWELLDQLPDTGVEKDFYKVTDSNGKEYLSIRLKLRDILYFEYIKRSRKVLIALADITYEYDCIFEKLVEELQPYDFVVNCRGNLVNLRHIEKIKGFTIYLDNGKELQIAQKRSSDFREEVNKFLQKNS